MTYECPSCGWSGEEPRELGGAAPDLCPDCLATGLEEVAAHD